MKEQAVQEALDQVVENIESGHWGMTMFALITYDEGVYLCLEGRNPRTERLDLSLGKGSCDWPRLNHPDGPSKKSFTSVATAEAAVELNPGMKIVQTDVIKQGQRALLTHDDDGIPLVELTPES
jgi:hypothetical protein